MPLTYACLALAPRRALPGTKQIPPYQSTAFIYHISRDSVAGLAPVPSFGSNEGERGMERPLLVGCVLSSARGSFGNVHERLTVKRKIVPAQKLSDLLTPRVKTAGRFLRVNIS